MANDNNKTNELVAADDDPTAELEAVTIRHAFGRMDPELEADANTFDIEKLDGEIRDGVSVANLKSDLKTRSETIERLQFDIEQLHSKWLGLEAEIKSREEVTTSLNSELKTAARKLERKESLLEQRDRTIESLKAEIRERENEARELQQLADGYLAEKTELEHGDEITMARLEIQKLQGFISNQSAELRDAVAQQQRTEQYADDLRRQLTDINGQIDGALSERARATEAAAAAASRLEDLEEQHDTAVTCAEELAAALKQAEDSHAEELRTLSLELRKAAESLAENQKANDALAADILDTRKLKEKLEQDLASNEETAARKIDELEKQIENLTSSVADYESRLDESSEATVAAASRLEALEKEKDTAVQRARELTDALEKAEESHAEELRTLRFELGEAEETLAENQKVNEELASNLIDTRGFKEQLEEQLASNEETATHRISELEKQIENLTSSIADYEYKLDKKTEAVNCLLAELAKKSQEIDSIGEMEDVIQEIDDRMSERIDDRARPPGDRVTRLLVGKIDEQELRFPLFKDRLTIGRTQQNDIQLDAPYISRRHAVVATEGDATRLIDWGSKNGVYVNSRRVTEHFLKNGDVVTIGTAKFRYEERPKRDT